MKFFVALMFFISSFSSFSNNMIGKVVPPYPSGLEEVEGSCVTSHLGLERMCDYAIGILQNYSDKRTTILAKKSIKKNRFDSPLWEVTDQLEYPVIKNGFWLSHGSCLLNGKLDQTVITIVKDSPTEYQEATSWAWKLNINTGKFEKISHENIKCLNGAWGL